MTAPATERRRLAAVIAVAPAALAAAAAALCPWLRGQQNELVAAAVWASVVWLSFVGWGGAVVAWLLPARRLDWGLRAAIGMAALVAAGGLLQVFRLASTGPIIGLTLGGLGAHAATRLRRREELALPGARAFEELRRTPVTTVLVFTLTVLVLAAVLGNLATPVSNVWDDLEAYFVFPKALLARGALEEPFSFRRVGALGGQSLLQSFLLAGSSVWRLNGFDNGICLLAIFGMVRGYARGRRGALFVPMVFVAFFVYRLHNVGSALSGTVFFLALFRVLDAEWPPDDPGHGRPLAILIALLGAAACTLRQNYAAAVLAILGASYALRLIDHPAAARRQVAIAGARTLGFLVLALLPWWIVSQRSSGTFLFPVVAGNARPDFGIVARVSAATELNFIIFNAFWNWPVRSIAFFVLGGLCLDEGKRNRTLFAFIVGAGLGTLAIVHGFQASDDIDSVSRYYMGFEVACVLAIMLKCLERVEREGRLTPRTFIAAALVVLAFGIHLWETRDTIAARFHDWTTRITAELDRRPGIPDPLDAYYRRIQATVPAGAPLLETLDQPFRLDFKRNRIFVCDEPGGASPKPGLPVYADVAHYEQYFREQSIRYLAYALGPGSPEYDMSRWRAQLQNQNPPTRNGHSRGTLLRQMAPIYIDFFHALGELAMRHRQLFDDGVVRVIDLESPPS
jgi:hypothetical protein